MTDFYDFTAETLQGKDKSMKDFEGKVVLVVNTASKCGLTPQYEGLQELYEKYKDDGLEILGFPCNQFANQEPGDQDAIAETCQINYGVTFTMFNKVDVNGSGAHPLFKYLRSALGGLMGNRIKWNFTKFLLDTEGNPVKRFPPTATPASLEKDIQKLLKA